MRGSLSSAGEAFPIFKLRKLPCPGEDAGTVDRHVTSNQSVSNLEVIKYVTAAKDLDTNLLIALRVTKKHQAPDHATNLLVC